MASGQHVNQNLELSEREEYQTTDGSVSHDESEEDHYDHGDHELRRFVEASMNELAESIRQRIPNFLNSPSTRHLSVLDRVQHIIDHTTTVHDENQTLKAENERLKQHAQLSNRSISVERTQHSEVLRFEIWYRREMGFDHDVFLNCFVSNGCNDLRLATSFNKQYLDQIGIKDPFVQIRILSSLRAYPNWTHFEDWLEFEVGLEEYADSFARVGLNEMNVIRSGLIDEKLLRQIGVSSPGHRKLFLLEIERLQQQQNSGRVDARGIPVPSFGGVLKHVWGGVRSELRDIVSQASSRGHRKERSRRWSPQPKPNQSESSQTQPELDSLPVYPGAPVAPQALPPSAVLSNNNDAVHASRISDGARFPERGSILPRQSSADSGRTSTIAPFFHHQGRTVPSAKDPYARSAGGIARSYSAPNLCGQQSAIPSLSNLKWQQHQQIVASSAPRPVAQAQWSGPANGQSAPARAAPITGRVAQSVPHMSGLNGGIAHSSRVAGYREVRSLSASNLAAIREQHESEHRRRREQAEKMIEQSVVSPRGNGRENRTVLVNVIAPEGTWPAMRKNSNSGQSTDVNLGSRDSSSR